MTGQWGKLLALPVDWSELLAEIEEFLAGVGVAPSAVSPVVLAIEEVVANVFDHGQTEGEEIRVGVEIGFDGDTVEVVIQDNCRPFSPDPPPDDQVRQRVKSRHKGGLGLYMVHKLMDGVEHSFAGGNRIRLTRRLPGGGENSVVRSAV